MTMCFREEDGTIRADPDTFGLDRPTDPTQVSRDFLSGGGGLFGTQKDYLALLRGVLQSDPRYEAERGGEKALLSPDSYAELFKGCVKTKQGLALLGEFVERPHYFNPPANSRNVEHSVGFLLNLEDFNGGRKAGSGTWSGAVKKQYWIDPTSGIVVSICISTYRTYTSTTAKRSRQSVVRNSSRRARTPGSRLTRRSKRLCTRN
jgi:hypothetical protein